MDGNWKVLSQDNINKLKDEGKYNKTDTDMNQYLGSLKNVLLTEQLKDKGLKAGEIIEIPLKSSKLLSNTNDEIAFDNVSEILEVQKSAGSIIETSTPGNFIPGKAELEEPDDSTSEGVTVLPPTGENMSYIAYSLLAISSLGILVAGILVIKKYILK